MGRKAANLGEHMVEWVPDSNQIKIFPKISNGNLVTDWFGLGNGKIKLNMGNPPTTIITSITGDTDVNKLAPTSPFKLRQWNFRPQGMHQTTRQLPTFNSGTKELSFSEASGVEMTELGIDVPISSHGIGLTPLRRGTVRQDNWASRGQRISAGQSGIETGTQIVVVDTKYGNGYKALFILKANGVILSFTTTPNTDGFVLSDTSLASQIATQVTEIAGESKIVEIAGGEELKLRLDNGLGLIGLILGSTVKIEVAMKNVGRVTTSAFYEFKNNYYMSPDGILPLLEDDIVNIYDDGESDTKLTISGGALSIDGATTTESPYAVMGDWYGYGNEGDITFKKIGMENISGQTFGNIYNISPMEWVGEKNFSSVKEKEYTNPSAPPDTPPEESVYPDCYVESGAFGRWVYKNIPCTHDYWNHVHPLGVAPTSIYYVLFSRKHHTYHPNLVYDLTTPYVVDNDKIKLLDDNETEYDIVEGSTDVLVSAVLEEQNLFKKVPVTDRAIGGAIGLEESGAFIGIGLGRDTVVNIKDMR